MIKSIVPIGRTTLVAVLGLLAAEATAGLRDEPALQSGGQTSSKQPGPLTKPQGAGPSAGAAKHPLPEMLGGELTVPRNRPGVSLTNGVPGEIIVKFKKGSKAAQTLQSTAGAKSVSEDLSRSTELAPLVAKHGVSAIEPVFGRAKSASQTKAQPEAAAQRDDLFRWTRLRLPKNAEMQQVLADLKAQPSVETVEPNYEWALAAEGLPDYTTDPGMYQQWHLLPAIANIPAAWTFLKTNGLNPGGQRDVVVAVIDTGVDYHHEELVGNIWTNPREIPGNGIDDDRNGFVDDIHGCSVVSDSRSHAGDPIDLHGHGTHVAGIIAATAFNRKGGVGVAFNVQIMAIRAAQYAGVLTTADVSEAILYAVDNGAEVINMSFGGYQRSQIVEDALAVALNQAVLVAAAGNDRRSALQYPSYPAALPFVVGVMATDRDGYLTSWSNFDPLGTWYAVSAPGQSIFSTLPGNQYASWSGTSMAAPIVSGIAALARSYYWQRDRYSSRFLMGNLSGAGRCQIGLYTNINAYRAVTEMPKPALVFQEYWLFDDKAISARNDADGRADSGETINLACKVGSAMGQASNVVATLRARRELSVFDDPYVSFLTNTVSFGNIGPTSTADNGYIYSPGGVLTGVQRPFIVQISSDCPNDHFIPFEMIFTYRDGSDPTNTSVFAMTHRFTIIVQRGRNVPGVISTNTLLAADQFWLVASSVLIETNATLTIGPGTQVQWGGISEDPYNPGPKNGSMIVRGNLRVEGASNQPVSFFPSRLVGGQLVSITVESGGTADMAFVKVLNPNLNGLRNVDHAYFEWDYGSSIVSAVVISNSIFHKFRGGGSISAQYFNRCLFDAGWLSPGGGQFVNCTFLQDNENDRALTLGAPVTTDKRSCGGVYSYGTWIGISNVVTWSNHTYAILPVENTSLQQADLIAQYFGGHITSIANQDEQTFLESYVHQWSGYGGHSDMCFIGLTDEGSPGIYHWTDGTPLSFTHWATNYPISWPAFSKHVEHVVSFGKQPDNYFLPVTLIGPWHNVELWSAYHWGLGIENSANFILKLPGVWTVAQLNAPVNRGELLNFVRTRMRGEILYNAFLSKYWDAHTDRWMRVYGAPNASGITYSAMHDNYWGTDSTTLIDYAIVDYYDDNFTRSRVDYAPPPANGFTTTYPFVERVLIGGSRAESQPTLGAGRTDFSVFFNRDMNTNIEPFVTFGPSPPHTDFSVTARDADFRPMANGWLNARTWQGAAQLSQFTGEGYQMMRISGAVAANDPWLVSGYDVARFRFKVLTMGVQSMTLQAIGQEGAIRLSWLQNDYDLLAGYNLYRADGTNGPWTRLNNTVIPPGSESFSDTNVPPAVPKFYKFTVVTTDMAESEPSNLASAAALDTISPVLTHTAVTSALPMSGLRLTATATDNLRVAGVTLFYRAAGSGSNYTSMAMVNVSGTSWSATIPGSAVQPPGVEYYISASDGISQVYSGTAVTPHTVVVTDTPTVASVTPNHGPAGGGTAVTVAGLQFQSGASVLFGGALASNVVVLSANQISCVTPPHFPATVEVKVINTNGTQATLLNGFVFESTDTLLSLPVTTGDFGTTVELALSAANLTGLRAADLTVLFNSAVLSGQSVRAGPLAAGWSITANTATAGRIRLALANPTAITGSGPLAYLSFNVVGRPPTNCALTLTNVLMNDGAITPELSPGQFTVNGFWSLAGTVRYYGSSTPVPSVEVVSVGVGTRTEFSGTNGAFLMTNLPTGSHTLSVRKTNDVAAITAYDASLVMQSAVGMITLSANQFIAADVNRNGFVSSMDASYILERSVGLIEVPFPNAGLIWDFVPSSRSYSLLTANQTGQDFTAILLGDVSGNWTPPAQGGGKASAKTDGSADALIRANTAGRDGLADEGIRAPTAPLVARAGEASRIRNAEFGMRNLDRTRSKSAKTNSPVVVGLKKLVTSRPPATNLWLLAKAPAPGIYSVDLTLSYDPAVTRLKGIQPGPLGGTLALASNTNQPGVVRAALAGAVPVQGVGGLLVVGVADVSDRSLRITRASINEGTVPVEVDPIGAAFDEDADGDGQTDWEELRAGTDANDARSSFCVATVTEAGDGSRTLRWSSVPGRGYRVQYKNRLSEAAWINVGGEVIATGGSASQVDGTARQAGQRFYRIVLAE